MNKGLVMISPLRLPLVLRTHWQVGEGVSVRLLSELILAQK